MVRKWPLSILRYGHTIRLGRLGKTMANLSQDKKSLGRHPNRAISECKFGSAIRIEPPFYQVIPQLQGKE
jgi:hypothetical protein